MNSTLLSVGLGLLAVAGCVALLSRIARSAVRLALNAAEAAAASGLADVSERRGDITGLVERRESALALKRERRLTIALAAGYFLLLAVPALGGVAREVYAACALLWIAPRRPIRPRVLAAKAEAPER